MSDQTSNHITIDAIKKQLEGQGTQCHYYEAVLNATTDLIALTDGMHIIDANASMTAFFNSLGKDVFSVTFSIGDFFEPINKFSYIYDGYNDKRWYEVALKGNKEGCRVGIMKDGVLHTFNLTLVLLKPYESIYVITLTDVTGLIGYKTVLEEGIKKSTREREKSQFLMQQYDKAMDTATLVYKCDLNGIISYANEGLCTILGYSYGELLGKHVSILRGPNISDYEYDEIGETLRRGEVYRGILENNDKYGGVHYFDGSIVPIHDEEGKIIEFLSLRHEITEVIKAKESAINTLEEKNKFFNQASHELRTPLNAIINFTDQALESFDEIFLDDESRDLVKMYIDRAHKNSQQLLHLINSLLEMAKLRAGKEKYEMVPTNIVSLARDVYEITGALNKKIELEYLLELPQEEIFIRSDVLRLRQILINLVSNALKFSERGYVKLSVKKVNDKCWIEIEDTGRGISEDKLDRIFEPFEQVAAHDQGTGLGLGIVNEHTKGMGMTLSVLSTLGVGSAFILKAPIINIEGDGTWII
ncbi:MAG TPA: PAS domain-containing sensor histidine kinase [Sulfuricurvum sp.]|nr:PAS domain-containing sensor histidine kinase [Sulfuricurvum sp.]